MFFQLFTVSIRSRPPGPPAVPEVFNFVFSVLLHVCIWHKHNHVSCNIITILIIICIYFVHDKHIYCIVIYEHNKIILFEPSPEKYMVCEMLLQVLISGEKCVDNMGCDTQCVGVRLGIKVYLHLHRY